MKNFGVMIVLSSIFVFVLCTAPDNSIQSPDGNVQLTFVLFKGVPHYSVFYKRQVVIVPSPLGLVVKDRKPFGPFELVKSRQSQHREKWTPVYGIRSEVDEGYARLDITLRETRDPARKIELTFRAGNDGVALRYGLAGDYGQMVLLDEKTEFNFEKDYICFALKRNSFGDNYEGRFVKTDLAALDPKDIIGPPLLVEGDGWWAAVTEAALKDYAGMSLKCGKDSLQFVSALAPLKNDGTKARVKTPFQTPWRVVLIGERCGDLLEATWIQSLNAPSEIDDVSWIKPGQAVWPWWNGRIATDPAVRGGEPGTGLMKYYIDFAAKYAIPGLVVDAGWYSLEMDAWRRPEKEDVLTIEETRADFYNVREVIDYGAQKGIDVFLWVHLASLKGRIEEVLAAYADWGAAGIKLDYFGGEDQELVQLLHKVIKIAAGHKLMVDYHGAYKPTGFTRTYPNFMTCEAVMGLEWVRGAKQQYTTTHNVTLPFTRMLAGPMDYTPGGFDLDGIKGSPKSVPGTRAHQLAMFVVYYSPLQMLVDYPAAYESDPETFALLRSIPTTWDETRFIDGYPAEYVVVARRSGKTWFVGAMTGEQARKVEIPLVFLPGDGEFKAVVCGDGRQRQAVVRTEKTVDHSTVLTAELAKGGGQVVRIHIGENNSHL